MFDDLPFISSLKTTSYLVFWEGGGKHTSVGKRDFTYVHGGGGSPCCCELEALAS